MHSIWYWSGTHAPSKASILPIEVQLVGGLVIGWRHTWAERIQRALEAEPLARVVARKGRARPGPEVRPASDVLDARGAEQLLLGSPGLGQLEDEVLLRAVLAHALSKVHHRLVNHQCQSSIATHDRPPQRFCLQQLQAAYAPGDTQRRADASRALVCGGSRRDNSCCTRKTGRGSKPSVGSVVSVHAVPGGHPLVAVGFVHQRAEFLREATARTADDVEPGVGHAELDGLLGR
ncbi:hypothetical protein ON010_g14490 [Phytophthora cinnamomi]|nr:hypothetical protein ON010_g14490 [Phytophthora cinnamomi]